jgi:hypothetical protein
MTAAIKHQAPRQFDPETFLLAMWLLYARAPKKETPESDGTFALGEIGEVRLQDQRLERATP